MRDMKRSGNGLTRPAAVASDPPPPPTIKVAGLSKTFSSRGGASRKVLSDATFSVAAGKTTAIVGESGAGKTTLVRCIAGLERPSSGQVLVHGVPVRLRPGRIAPVQMVFQNAIDALDPMRSVGSSIAEPLRGQSRGQRRERVDELLSLVGISPSRAKDRPGNFSGGQLQRVVIARALAPSPSVLLCDEPTSALDLSVQAQVLNLLMTLQAKHHFAGILVTHDLAIARALADDILVLRAGQVLFHGEVGQLLDPSAELDEYVRRLVRTSQESELPVPAKLPCASSSLEPASPTASTRPN